jgi:hypothetical protein
MTDGQPVDGDADLHGEHGAHRGEHTGRCLNPIIKVTDLAWLEFVKPDLKRAKPSPDFGFVVAASKPDALYLWPMSTTNWPSFPSSHPRSSTSALRNRG